MKSTQLVAATAITLLSATSGHASTADSGKITAGTTFGTNNAFQFTNDSTADELITALPWDLIPFPYQSDMLLLRSAVLKHCLQLRA